MENPARKYFRGAYLQKVNFQQANLKKANLIGVNSQGAYLQGADLRGSNFFKAKNLNIDQLSKVKTLYDVKLDNEYSCL